MGGPTRVEGASCPQVHSGSGDLNSTTVRQGEASLRQVTQRLQGQGVKVTLKDMEDANPNLKNKTLQTGQDVCLPQPKTDSGPKIPKGRVGDYEIPPPIPKRETEDTFERGTNRKDDRDRLDRSRPRDERDLDPNQIKKIKEQNSEQHRQVVNQQIQKGVRDAEKKGNNSGDWIKEREREQMDDLIKKQKYRVRP
jgi:hypothetical protein